MEEINWNSHIQTINHYLNLYTSAGILFTDDVIAKGKSVKHYSQKGIIEEDIKIVEKLYGDLFRSIDGYDTHAYNLLKYEDRVVAMAILCAARKENKVMPYVSPHFIRIYGLEEDEVEKCLNDLLQSAVRIPILKRDSSWQSIQDVPPRRDTEIIIQGIYYVLTL